MAISRSLPSSYYASPKPWIERSSHVPLDDNSWFGIHEPTCIGCWKVCKSTTVAIKFFCFSTTMPHEMGHAFGLRHTFAGISEITSCGDCYERTASDTAGDFCSDTVPVAKNWECSSTYGAFFFFSLIFFEVHLFPLSLIHAGLKDQAGLILHTLTSCLTAHAENYSLPNRYKHGYMCLFYLY